VIRRLVATAVLVAGARVAAADPPDYAVWVSIPSLDGAAGAELGAERRVAPRLAVAVELGARESASGDFDGLTVGGGGELRWFFRGGSGWSRDGLDRAGWFTGVRIDVARTGLEMDDRSLGSIWQVGAGPELGYRLAPWRGLSITGVVTATERV
jgi:hypothetical protein